MVIPHDIIPIKSWNTLENEFWTTGSKKMQLSKLSNTTIPRSSSNFIPVSNNNKVILFYMYNMRGSTSLAGLGSP